MEWTTDTAVDTDRNLLTGRTVRLRGLRDADLPQLTTWWQDPAIGSLQMTTVCPPSEAATRDLLNRWSANQDTGAGFSIETIDGPELIGHLSFFNVRARNRSAVFAIVLGLERAGQGYGSEAVRLAVRYGFTELNLHRIELHAMAFNQRALAAYRSAGFVEEGRRRDGVFHAGQWHDEVTMSILESDPRPPV